MAPSALEAIRSHPPDLSWDDLRLFLAVVAHGSMNGAAQATGQSQPTVARRIRLLEEALEVALFERGPNRLDLTEAGRALVEAASPRAEAAAAAANVAAAYRPHPQSPVRITATMSVTMFLSRSAAELSDAVAPVEIAFIPSRRRLDLSSGEADIALRMACLPQTDELIARKIGRIASAVYARSHDIGSVIGPPDDPDLSLHATLIGRFAEGRPIAARIGDMPVRYQAVRSGLGAAVLPCWLGDADPDLVRVLDPPDDLIESVFLIVHRRRRTLPSVTRVVEALIALFKKNERLLAGAR